MHVHLSVIKSNYEDVPSDPGTVLWCIQPLVCGGIVTMKVLMISERLAYVATSSFAKRSLTLAPATLRNAAPHMPVRNLKTRKTACASVSSIFSSRSAICHTYVWAKCDQEAEEKEKNVGNTVDDVPAVHFREWSDEEWSVLRC
jgi:hypothetical protein